MCSIPSPPAVPRRVVCIQRELSATTGIANCWGSQSPMRTRVQLPPRCKNPHCGSAFCAGCISHGPSVLCSQNKISCLLPFSIYHKEVHKEWQVPNRLSFFPPFCTEGTLHGDRFLKKMTKRSPQMKADDLEISLHDDGLTLILPWAELWSPHRSHSLIGH